MKITTEITALKSNQQRGFKAKFTYEKTKGLEFTYEGRLVLIVGDEDLQSIIQQVMNIPGLDDSVFSDKLSAVDRVNEHIQYEMENPVVIRNLRLAIYVVFVINFNSGENPEGNIENYNKFFVDNFHAFFVGAYNESLPLIYFLSRDENKSVYSESLYRKSFLHKISISHSDRSGEEQVFSNFFKPMITPLVRIHLEGAELQFYNQLLRSLDRKLRRFQK